MLNPHKDGYWELWLHTPKNKNEEKKCGFDLWIWSTRFQYFNIW